MLPPSGIALSSAPPILQRWHAGWAELLPARQACTQAVGRAAEEGGRVIWAPCDLGTAAALLLLPARQAVSNRSWHAPATAVPCRSLRVHVLEVGLTDPSSDNWWQAGLPKTALDSA